MNLTSPSQVKAWCIEHDFHPNKVLGQNFLVDRNALEAIVDAAALPTGARVLEIGPGLGVLTEEMLRRGLSVTAIEKDPVLAERLAEALGNPPNLTVHAGDALDLIKEGACDGFPALVSNLPYQAGTRILLELTQIGKECHAGCEIRRLVGTCIMPKKGVFCRILEGGTVRPGDSFEVVKG